MRNNVTLIERLSPEEIQDVIAKYLSGVGAPELAKRLGVSYTSVYSLLRKMNIAIRPGSAYRSYTLNEKFFDEIETEAQAYWLGFLAADGAIEHHHISLSLKTDDIDSVQHFANAVETNAPVKIYNYPYGSCVKMLITSEHMASALSKYGIVSGKSKTLTWIKVPEQVQMHFARGYFDGDGGFGIVKRAGGKQRIYAGVTSTYAYLDGFRNLIAERCDVSIPDITDAYGKRAYTIRWSHSAEVKKIADVMYANATIFMPRKRERVEGYFAVTPPVNRRAGAKHGIHRPRQRA